MAADRGVDERMVAAVWERQSYDPVALNTLGLRLIFRGVPSDAGGPDYQDVILARGDREVIRGDVEFHVRASDWYRHGHHRNRRYNRVVLHVVYTKDMDETKRADGAVVPVLALEGHARAVPLAGATRQLQRHPCVDAFARLHPEALNHFVVQAGLARLAARSDRVEAELESLQPNQVIYAGLLEGMGYASNRETFRKLADAAPHAWLVSLPSGQRADALLQASGLESVGLDLAPARLDAREWRLARLRPANHPALRIRGVCAVLERLGSRPADSLLETIARASSARQLRRLFEAQEGSTTCIGGGRADELVVSVALPFVAAYAGETQLARD